MFKQQKTNELPISYIIIYLKKDGLPWHMSSQPSKEHDVIVSLVRSYEHDATTCIYGPGGAGKTLLCMLSLIKTVQEGKKVIFIDTEKKFPVDRFQQICENYQKILASTIFFQPESFEELSSVLELLSTTISPSIGMIIVDTLTHYFRLEISAHEDKKAINSALGEQLDYLSEMRKKLGIPILITTQVYADMDQKEKVNPIGGDLIKTRCKTIIELEKLQGNLRRAILIKNRYEERGKHVVFEIVKNGISLL